MTRWRRALVILIAGVLGLGALWFGGLVWFGASMPSAPAADSNPTDAIVVLTGGEDRLAEGLRLLAAGRAKRLFVSGVNPGVRKAELMRVAGVKQPGLAALVEIGQRANNTRGNAAESAAWLRRRGFTSMRLVTANYHMRRSMIEFRWALPKVRIVAHPVFPKPVNPGPWWRKGRALAIVAAEFNKYLIALLRPGGGPG